VLKPLTGKQEELYVLPGSDAENYASRRFPHKRLKRVGRQLRAATIQQSLMGLRLSFQRDRAKGLNATYHWTLTGKERIQATVRIADGKIAVETDHTGTPDVTIVADSATWLRVLSRDYSILRAILLRKVAVKGPMSLLRAFGRCFV
jgi:alkyl sulfatase BDS1-like metallo-beta-lactamase superfamily hydrolase